MTLSQGLDDPGDGPVTLRLGAGSCGRIAARVLSPHGGLHSTACEHCPYRRSRGDDAAETVTFALDGISYEIDLSSANAAKLRDALKRFAAAARKTGGRAKATQRRAAASRSATEIRAWAPEQGMAVSLADASLPISARRMRPLTEPADLPAEGPLRPNPVGSSRIPVASDRLAPVRVRRLSWSGSRKCALRPATLSAALADPAVQALTHRHVSCGDHVGQRLSRRQPRDQQGLAHHGHRAARNPAEGRTATGKSPSASPPARRCAAGSAGCPTSCTGTS